MHAGTYRLFSHHNPAASPWNAVYYVVKSATTRQQVFHALFSPLLWTCAFGYDLFSSQAHLPSHRRPFDPIYAASEDTDPDGQLRPTDGVPSSSDRPEGPTRLDKPHGPAFYLIFVINNHKRVT